MAEFNEPLSRNEAILQNILGASNELLPPQSRVEAILQAILNNTPYTEPPQSAIEELLIAIKNSGEFDKEIQSRNEAILLAKLRGEQYTEPPQSRIEELLIQWLEAYEEKTVTGAFVTISDAIADKAFNAVIAKIVSSSGVTGVTVARTKKNLCNLGTITVNEKELCKICSGAVFPAGTYRLSGIASSTDTDHPYCQVMLYRNGTVVQSGKYFTVRDARTSVSFTPSAPFDEIYFYASNSAAHSSGDTAVFADLQLEKASAASAYEQFNGNVYDVSWADVAGSVTDGEINLTTGVLTVGANTYQLTPTEIKALSGTNKIWADTGDITVKYLTEQSGV